MPGLYAHIPFCRSKCAYCDFTSFPGKETLINGYIDSLSKEAALYPQLAGSFKTLYVGGGTPSLLSAGQMGKLFYALLPLTGPFSALAESTFEANPESVDAAKAKLLRKAGISRISLGLQAAQDGLLKKLGRIAMLDDFLKAFKILRSAGFTNISCDLMCGLPGQTAEDFTASLDLLLSLEPEHVSIYPLEVHEGTEFSRAGVKEEPETAALMYETAAAELERRGMERYEISNFARVGRQSLHNLNYWQQGSYLGLGAAAASYLNGERRVNTADLDAYMYAARSGRHPPVQSRETLTGRAKRAERIMLGLRKTGGIELEREIIIEFNEEIDRLLKMGLIENDGRLIRIKSSRIYLANAVFREFV